MSGPFIEVVIAANADVGERADVVLARRVPALTRRVARALALRGRLRVDGRPAPPSTRVALGQTLRLLLGAPSAPPPGEPRIVATSDRFVYVDKPSGWHTHRLRPDDPPSVADAVARSHPECASASTDVREGGAIHRLDRDTTGLVAFARTRAAWVEGRAAMGRPTTLKVYVALARAAEGLQWPPPVPWIEATTPRTSWPSWPAAAPRPRVLEAWSITAPLGRGTDRDRVCVRDDGLAAHTIVVPVGRGRDDDDADAPVRIAFVVRLASGRRHQIRVHLAHLGCPIVGDVHYGPPSRTDAGPLLLHCTRLDLSASCPGEPVVDAELPPHLSQALRRAGIAPWAGSGRP